MVSLQHNSTLPPPTSSQPHTVCIYMYFDFGKGGEANQREGKKGNSSQSWVENTNMIDCISSLETLLNTSKDAI